MKKVLRFLGILLLLFLLVIVLIPILFKDKLVALVQEEASKSVNATVSFEDVSLSMWRSFPDLSLGVEGLKIVNNAPFEGTELVSIGNIRFTVDLMSVITGNQYSVESIELADPSFHVVILPDGTANYDIVPPSEEEAAEDTTAAEPFELKLKSYSVTNLNLIYDDQQGKMKAVIGNLNHSGKGDFSDALVALRTKTEVEALTFAMDGMNYLNKATVSSTFDLDYEQETGRMVFGENEVRLNDLGLNFQGEMTMGDPVISMNFNFSAPQTEFKSVLSLIPAVYMRDFEGVQTAGSFNLNGKVAGDYNMEGEDLPMFELNLKVKEANFRYPDLPVGVDKIAVDLAVTHPAGAADATVINLKSFHMEVGGNPVDASLYLTNPVSDPNVDTKLMARLDLAKLAQAVPVEGMNYKGQVEADLQVKGRVSEFEAGNAENVNAAGYFKMTGFLLESDSLPVPVNVDAVSLAFTPKQVNLEQLAMRFGGSDLNASGVISNFVSYALADSTLQGNFTLSGQKLDLNPFMGETAPTEEEAPATEEPLAVIAVPTNLNISLDAAIGQVLFGTHNISNLKGQLRVKNGVVAMKNVGLGLLGGTVALDGSYAAPTTERADVDMNVKLDNFEVSKLAAAFETIKTIAPVAEGATGNINTAFSLKTPLKADMSPDLDALYSKGVLVTKGVTVAPKFMGQVADFLKNDSYRKLDLGNTDLSYEIRDGRVNLEPMNLNVGGVNGTLSGSTGLDQTLNLDLKTAVPVGNVQAASLLNQLGASQGGKVDLTARITGTFKEPKVSTSLGDITGNVVETIKEEVTKKVEEVKQDVINKANEEAQKLLEQARAKGDQLVAEAENQARTIRAEGKKQADNLRAEAKKKADKLIADASGNFLKEAAAKEGAKRINDEADKQAKKIEAEANKKADELVAKAKAERDRLISEAEAKAKIGG